MQQASDVFGFTLFEFSIHLPNPWRKENLRVHEERRDQHPMFGGRVNYGDFVYIEVLN